MIKYSPDLAMLYSLDEAIIIKYFIDKMKHDTKEFRDNKKWVSKKYIEIANEMKVFRIRQVERIINSLLDRGILLREVYINKFSYSFSDSKYTLLMAEILPYHSFSLEHFQEFDRYTAIVLNKNNNGLGYIPPTVINVLRKKGFIHD